MWANYILWRVSQRNQLTLHFIGYEYTISSVDGIDQHTPLQFVYQLKEMIDPRVNSLKSYDFARAQSKEGV